MIITLSPAKLLDFESPIFCEKRTRPFFEKEADELYGFLQDANVGEISKLMNLNPPLSHDVYQYVQAFSLKRTPQRQAVFAYNGIAYQGLEAKSLTDTDLDFAQNHLVHISGLYGVLRPLDMIKPYRLEMQIRLVNDRGNNLYDFWTDTISKYMAKQMKADDNIWINLASKEYAKAVNKNMLPKGVRIVTPIFKQYTDKGPKQIVVYAKKARGMMTRFIIQNKITDVEHLKGFDVEGYCYSPQLSTESEWTFIR